MQMKTPRSYNRAKKRMQFTGKYVKPTGEYASRKECTEMRQKWIAFQKRELEKLNKEQEEDGKEENND